MKNFVAYDACNSEYEEFETIEEARAWLKEGFLIPDEGYNPEMTGSKIYSLIETVSHDVIDRKSDYKYESEDDAPEDCDGDEIWPYSSEYDEIWEHKFVPVEISVTEYAEPFKKLLAEYMEWEAMLIEDNSLWSPFAEKDAIRGKSYDKMMELQAKRNALLNQLSLASGTNRNSISAQ